MDRIGHSSTRAAMIYMHGSDARQHEIAVTRSKLARQELKPKSKAVSDRSERGGLGVELGGAGAG